MAKAMKELNLKNLMRLNRADDDAERIARQAKVNADLHPTSWWVEEASKAAEKATECRKAYLAELKKINAVINEHQQKCKERLLTAESLCDKIAIIEEKRLSGAPKKAWEGIRITNLDVNAQEFPNAYKWTPESTKVDLVYRNGSWRITSIERRECCKRGGTIILTDVAKEAILASLASL